MLSLSLWGLIGAAEEDDVDFEELARYAFSKSSSSSSSSSFMLLSAAATDDDDSCGCSKYPNSINRCTTSCLTCATVLDALDTSISTFTGRDPNGNGNNATATVLLVLTGIGTDKQLNASKVTLSRWQLALVQVT